MNYISIIIPMLNEAERIDSLMAMFEGQSLKNFELIVVDGRSEDQTQTLVKKSKTSFPVKLVESPKRNPGFQRNLGVNHAKGEYVVFFDADTQIGPDYFKELTPKLERYHIDFASTRMMPDTNKFLDKALTYLINLFMIGLTRFNYPFMSASNLIFRRAVYEKIGGFDETVVLSDDHELVQRAAKKGYTGRIFYTPLHLFSFRRFEREGRLTVIYKYTKAMIYMIVKGPIRKSIYEYKMGGKTP